MLEHQEKVEIGEQRAWKEMRLERWAGAKSCLASQVRISVSILKAMVDLGRILGCVCGVCVTLLELCFKISFLGLPWWSSG